MLFIQGLVNSSLGFVHTEHEDGIFLSSLCLSNCFAEHPVKIFRWSALELEHAFTSPKVAGSDYVGFK